MKRGPIAKSKLDRPLQPASIPPEMPLYLDQYGQEFWNFWAPRLFDMGVLTEIDGAALAQAAINFSIVRRCSEFLNGQFNKEVPEAEPYTYRSTAKSGGFVQKNRWPQVKLMQEASKALQSWLQEFGGTPAARQKLRVDATKEIFDDSDKDFFNP